MTPPSEIQYTLGSRRERLALAAVFCALALASLVPIWVTRFLPLVDEPNHLSAIYIWHNLVDPRSPLHRFYELSIEPVSYFLHYFIAHQAAFVVGVEAAHKLALSLYVLALPLAGLWWCRRTRRSPWLSLLLFPLPYSYFWAFGFHPFNLGLVIFLLAVAAFDLLFEAVHWTRIALCAGLGVLCFLSHPIPLAMLYLAVPVLLLVCGLSWRKLGAATLALSPTALLLWWQARRSATSSVDWKQVTGDPLTLDLQRWRNRLRWFDDYTMNVVSGNRDTQLFIALLACGVLLLIAGFWRRQACFPHRPNRAYPHRGAVIALVMLVAYLVLPENFGAPVGILIVSGRFAPVVMFLFLLAAPVPPRDWRRWLVLPAVPIALMALLNITAKYRTFAEYMRPLPALVAKCKRDDDVLTLSMHPQTYYPAVELAPFRLLPEWVQILHGGYAPDHWQRPIAFPFRVKHALPAPSWIDPQPAPQFLNGPYACVVAHRLKQPLPRPDWKQRGRIGEWSVYRRR